MVQLAGKEVGRIGFGLMGKHLEPPYFSIYPRNPETPTLTPTPGFTWRPEPCPEEQAFEAMRAALATGCVFWNGGEIYGTPSYNSMTLLERYFAKYPEDADKVVLSIKGAVDLKTLTPNSSPEGLRRSLDNVTGGLKGRKFVDMFECARRDPKHPLEETFGILNKEYVDTGKIGGISLSEVSAATIHEAVKITKVVAVEVELSLWSTDPLENGVAAACAEHGIPMIAYSPLGRGVSLITHPDTLSDPPWTASLRNPSRLGLELTGATPTRCSPARSSPPRTYPRATSATTSRASSPTTSTSTSSSCVS
ncbi:aldo/keto reductase [Candidatus Bathyarchaeota archaeon]|nr:aldo/keto reductase [Candidatus Bathyarchaeota archaeon]